jgi:hypothetical protein
MKVARYEVPSFCPYGTNTLNTCPHIRSHITPSLLFEHEHEYNDEGASKSWSNSPIAKDLIHRTAISYTV